MTRALLAALASLLALPAAALGATVTSRADICGKGCVTTTLELRAEPGEVNDVVVEPADSVVVFSDRVPLRDATDECEQLDAMRVRCTRDRVDVQLGDGDDRIRGPSTTDAGEGDDIVEGALAASGGAGNDRLAGRYLDGDAGDDVLEGGADKDGLNGGAGDDLLEGAADTDRLNGGPGRDVVHAGGGDDVLADGGEGSEADVFDGGEGVDQVSYSLRPDDVGVDLAADASTDGDALVSVEGSRGGNGNDRLVGDEGPNLLDGGGGQDVLVGAGGPDSLDGNAGYDRLEAGEGNDTLFAHSADAVVEAPDGRLHSPADVPDQEADADAEGLFCGAGFDLVQTIDDDFVAPDCERLRYKLRPHGLRLQGNFVKVYAPCPRTFRHRGRCRGTVTVRSTSDSNESGYTGSSGHARFVVGRNGRWVRVLAPVGLPVTVSVRFGSYRTSWRVRSYPKPRRAAQARSTSPAL